MNHSVIGGGISLSLFIAASLLSGCGNESSNNNGSNNALGGTTILSKRYDQAVTVNGVVSNAEGSVDTAEIKATDQSGEILATTQLQGTKVYTLDIPSGSVFPLVLTAYIESSDETFKALMISPSLKKVDISPFSTQIIDKAIALGGFSEKNIMQATMTTSKASLGRSNRTEAGFRGDPTSQYGGWH